MNKNMVNGFENSLTPQQQEVVDEAYEALMSNVQILNFALYEKLRANELSVSDVYRLKHTKNKEPIVNEDEQYDLF